MCHGICRRATDASRYLCGERLAHLEDWYRTMNLNLILAVIALVFAAFGAACAAITLRDRIHSKGLTKIYKTFVLEILAAIYDSEKISSATDPKACQREVETIVKTFSNRYFNKPRPPTPPDPIREAIFGESFSYHLECNICKELHQPDVNGSCSHCGLPAPFWSLLAFRSLRDQHKILPFTRSKDQNKIEPNRGSG